MSASREPLPKQQGARTFPGAPGGLGLDGARDERRRRPFGAELLRAPVGEVGRDDGEDRPRDHGALHRFGQGLSAICRVSIAMTACRAVLNLLAYSTLRITFEPVVPPNCSRM